MEMVTYYNNWFHDKSANIIFYVIISLYDSLCNHNYGWKVWLWKKSKSNDILEQRG
jgi:hypothetical protein